MCSKCLFNENTEYAAFSFSLENLLLEINSFKYVGINDTIINKAILIGPKKGCSILSIGLEICNHDKNSPDIIDQCIETSLTTRNFCK